MKLIKKKKINYHITMAQYTQDTQYTQYIQYAQYSKRYTLLN